MKTFTDRRDEANAAPDVLEYGLFSQPLRVKIAFAIEDLIGDDEAYRSHEPSAFNRYKALCEHLYRKFGLKSLSGARQYNSDIMGFIAKEPDVGRILDIVELAVVAGRNQGRKVGWFVDTINAALRKEGVGYELSREKGEVHRVDNTYAHAEITKPALALLLGNAWRGADDEFRKAHEHHRHGRNKEAMTEAAKSLESVMKTICAKRKWVVDPHANSRALIDVCFQQKLIPDYWQTSMKSLRSLLESSVPTGRNKSSAHGQGPDPVEVPDHIAGYMLHMAAAAIVFLVKADEALG